MSVRYIGPCMDASGYANAVRNNIAAMARCGIDFTVSTIRFETSMSNHGTLSKIVNSYINRPIKFNKQIIHCTPENWGKLIHTDKYNIGYTTWETDKLPKDWPGLINQVDEVWVPSTWNKDVFESSGVTKPIYVIPHAIDETILKQNMVENFGIDRNLYNFYSIFQWTERKNPECLIESFLEEFSSEENVQLVLKTYNMGWDLKQQSIVKEKIRAIKAKVNKNNPPKLMFIGNLLSASEIASVHNSCDCFVLPHRGEGFGIPIAEAMHFENLTISTDWSGSKEFCNEKNSLLIDYKLVPVTGMPWGKYTTDQNWAEPNKSTLKKLMRSAFEKTKKNDLLRKEGKVSIVNKCSFETIGNKIKERLDKIDETI